MAYQYNVGGHVTTAYNLAKLYQIPAALSESGIALVTVLVAKCNTTCTVADNMVSELLRDSCI